MHDFFSTTFKQTEANGVAKNRVVIFDVAEEFAVKYPTADNVGPIAGATAEAQSLEDHDVRVITHGIARLEAAHAIAVGARVISGGTDGRIQTEAASDGDLVNVVGIALQEATQEGDIIDVLLRPQVYQS